MRALVLIVLGATLAGCGVEPQASKAREDNGSASSEFPKVGDYHIVREVTAGDTTRRYESDSHIAASTREEFEQLVAGGGESLNCHDRHSDRSASGRLAAGLGAKGLSTGTAPIRRIRSTPPTTIPPAA